MQPFGDMRVRQALGEAINRQAIVNSLYGGIGVVASEFLAPGMLGYNDDIQAIPYDPTHAKQLLADAGMPTVSPPTSGTSRLTDRTTRTRRRSPGSLQRLGPDQRQVQPEDEDWTAYLDDARQPQFSTWMLGWTGDNGDPDNFLYFFFGNKPAQTCPTTTPGTMPRSVTCCCRRSGPSTTARATRCTSRSPRSPAPKQPTGAVRAHHAAAVRAVVRPGLRDQSDGYRALQHRDHRREAVGEVLRAGRRSALRAQQSAA